MARKPKPAVAVPDEAASSALTIGRLVEQLGVPVLDLVSAPAGLEVPVAHAVIYDPLEPPSLEPHDVVLAVGVDPATPAAAGLIESAAAGGGSAVLFKTSASIPDLLTAAAERAGIAILAVTSEITWSQLHVLVRTAIATSSEPEAAGSVPLGDLFALANAVAAMVGGSTTIEDPQSRVLAYSSQHEIDEARRQTILGRRVPDEWIELLRERGVFKQLWASTDVVRVDDLTTDGSVRPRIAIAVRAGDEILGSIWVAQGEAPFDTSAEEALRRAADIAALHIVSSRARDDVERRIRGDQLRAIFEGRGPLDVVASRLGIDPDGDFAVMAFEIQTERDAEIVLQRGRALDLVTLYCEAYRRRATSVAIGNMIYTLLPVAEPDAESDEALRRLAIGIADRAALSMSVDVRVGIGSRVRGVAEITRSRAEADQVVRVLARAGSTGLATIGEVRAPAMLLELADIARERPHLLSGHVDLLLAHDESHGTDYIATLTAYFESFGDVPTAAARLAVHPNTFRYRLRRLCELGELDLGDPDQRLAAELQLRLR